MGWISSFYDRLERQGSVEIYTHVKEEFFFLLSLSCFYMRLDKGNRYWQTLLLVVSTLLFIYHLVQFSVTAYLASNHLPTFALSMAIAVDYLLAVIVLFCLVSKRSLITRFFQRCMNGFYEYKGSSVLAETEHLRKKGKKDRNTVLIGGPIVLAVCIAIAMFFGPILDKYSPGSDKKESIISESINKNLPVPVWVPFKTTNTHVMILSVLQLFAALALGFNMPACLSIYMYLVQQIVIQLEILNESILRLNSRTQTFINKINPNFEMEEKNKKITPLYQKCVQACLRENVIHHQQIIESVKDIKELLAFPLLGYNSIMIVMIAVSLTAAVSGSSSYGSKAISFALVFAEISALCITHYYGQRLINVSTTMRERLYEIEWYLYDKKVRLILMIMLEKTKTPLALTPFGISSMNWETFSAICNSAYTYMNLMLAVEKK